jgi:ribonuclease H / adenosylcobalamin/alpha-ribazole phosphatase
VTRAARKPGKTRTDAERRRLARAHSRAGAGPEPQAPPPGWAVAWCDGGSRGNPGPAAFAYLIDQAGAGELARAVVGIGVATAATAEHRGVQAALERALSLGLTRVEVRSDSRLVIDRLRGESQPSNPTLKGLVGRSLDAAQRIGAVRFRWVPREHNRAADSLVDASLHDWARPPAQP